MLGCKWISVHSHDLTHSIPLNESFVPRRCAHFTRRMSPSFHKRYCWCLGKQSQTETGFETNFLPVTGKNSCHFLSAVSTCKSAKPRWSRQSSRCTGSNFHGRRQQMWNLRWMAALFRWKWGRGGEWTCGEKWQQHCLASSRREFSEFYQQFFLLLLPAKITWATRSYSLCRKSVKLPNLFRLVGGHDEVEIH